MWRRRGSIGGGSTTSSSTHNTGHGSAASDNGNSNGNAGTSRHSETGGSSSSSSNPIASFASRNSFFGSDPRAADRPLVFSIDVPTTGPLGLDLRARHVERDRPQRGAVVKGFRPLQGGRKGYVEETGRVHIGDILQIIHQTYIDDMPFEEIVKHAMQLQHEPDAWPLKLEFRREQAPGEVIDDANSRPRRSSFFRSSIVNPAQDSGTFNDKLQYFRGFFANKMPTGGAAPKAKEKAPMPSHDTVNEMYRELLVKRGVPDDVMDELVRIEPLENKWHVVWFAQQHDGEDHTQANIADATRVAESLVELKWDNRGLKYLEGLRNKISTNSNEWVEAFLARFGLDYLTMKLPDPSPFPVEHSKFEKATRICDVVLRILRSITQFSAGVEAITNVPGLVKRMALCLHTDNGDLKKHTLQLLGIVCYNSAAGHQAVIEAFNHYKDTKGETIRFSCLRDALKSTRYSLAFKEDVLSFVNLIVNKAIRLEDRLAIRSDFMALKMSTYFEEIRAKSQAVQRQKLPSFSGPPPELTMSSSRLDTAPPSPVRQESAPTPQRDSAAMTLAATAAAASLGAAVKAQLESSLRTTSFPAHSERRPSQTSRSAPSSPRERSSSTDFDRFSATSSSRQSIPSMTDDGSSRTMISSSVTQLRHQLDSMEKQIEVFERFMEDDRKDTIYEQTDLSSAESVFKSLWETLSSDVELQSCLLSILQQLLFIPADRVIGKEMWWLSERLMKQVALLSPVEEVRNFEMGYEDRKAVLRLRDKYVEFLQKCADEDPTFRFHIGPIVTIENRKEDSGEDLVLSDRDSSDETDDEDASEGVAARDHPELLKYFKLLKMGMPLDLVQRKMQIEIQSFDVSILETPDMIIAPEKESEEEVKAGGIRAEEHEKYAKFFKLMKFGMAVPLVQLKMRAEGVDDQILESPDMLLDEDGNEWKEEAVEEGGIPAKDHEKFKKFFKLLEMHVPMEHVKVKASREGLDGALLETPDVLLDAEGKIYVAPFKGIPVKDHEKFKKFFKLLEMHVPMEHVKVKASREGLDGALLETPDVLLDAEGNIYVAPFKGIPVKDHEKFKKFFKLLEMGQPLEQLKMRASREGLDGALLETPDVLLNEDGTAFTSEAAVGIPVKDHDKFKKYFTLLKMGMPLEQVKLKASNEGVNGALLDTPGALLDAEGNEIKDSGPVCMVKVSEHLSYAKHFKLLKMGKEREHVESTMTMEGLDVKLLDTPDAMIPETAPKKDTKIEKPSLPPPPPKPKLRNLYWDAVQKESVSGTVWEEFAKSAPSSSAAPADADAKSDEKDRVLDKYVDQLADIFVNKPAKAKESEAKKPNVKKRAPTRVALIDVKRANNIGIMLARFRLPYAKIRDAILQVDKELLSSEKLSSMIQFAPEDAEIEVVKGYTGNPKLLGDAEQYFRELIAVPRISTRLQAIHATWQFDSYVDEQTRLVESVRNACSELKQCARLREIFKVVLTLGNALNDGTARGGAKGFRLSILLKLNQVKASDNSITLLNYLAELLRSKDPALLNFHEDLPSIATASRVTTQVLKAGESAVRKAATLICNELEQHAKLVVKDENEEETKAASDAAEGPSGEDAPVKDCFQDAIRPFAEQAQQKSERIQLELDEMSRSFSETVAFYGEDPSSPDNGPDSFFSIFDSFAKLLQSADRDNERRRTAEERRIRLAEETKKRNEMLKNKKNSIGFMKTGDADYVVATLRGKRDAEGREEPERLRSSSRSSATSQTPRSANGTMLSSSGGSRDAAACPPPALSVSSTALVPYKASFGRV